MEVGIDQGECVRSGQCVLAAPEVLHQRDDDGTVVPQSNNPPAELRNAAHAAAGVCPARAVTIDDT
jgi:ferredoxin